MVSLVGLDAAKAIQLAFLTIAAMCFIAAIYLCMTKGE
jgi:hypothetical protein